MSEPREGSELIRATRAFATEDWGRSSRLFWSTVAVALALLGGAIFAPSPLAYTFSVALGLVVVRLFIFYHDHQHGAIFRGSKFYDWVMAAFGLLILTPSRIWKDSHNYHHAHTSKMVGSSIGSYPIITVRMYKMASRKQRFQYRIARHPLTILLGYLTVFMLGMCVKPFLEQPKRHWGGAVALLLHGALLAGLTSWGGFGLALQALVVPMVVACAAGSYLFYAQHNYPEMQVYDRRQWSYEKAALHSSSMMQVGPVMRWFTGDIGFHHVHHLNSMIPFYRLEEAMNGTPELQTPGITKLKLGDIWACLRLDLWDPEQQRMVTFSEAHTQKEAAPAT